MTKAFLLVKDTNNSNSSIPPFQAVAAVTPSAEGADGMGSCGFFKPNYDVLSWPSCPHTPSKHRRVQVVLGSMRWHIR